MRKNYLFVIFVLCMVLSACRAPVSTNNSVKNNEDVNGVTSNGTGESKQNKTLNWTMLEGEWTLESGMVDGEEYTAEDAGYTTELSFEKNGEDITAHYWRELNGLRQEFDAQIELIDTPVYEGCGNDEWSVQFHILDVNLFEDEEFYATLIDENTLLFQHLYPFDGTQGVSYQYYTRK